MVKACVWSVGSCTNNSTLHWAKEVVVKVGYINSLVNHNVINLTSQRVIIGKRTTNGGIGLSAEGGVISFDNNWSVIIKQNKGITS